MIEKMKLELLFLFRWTYNENVSIVQELVGVTYVEYDSFDGM